MKAIKKKYKEDGLRLMLGAYRNFDQLYVVSKLTNVPLDVLERFVNGEDCLSPEQDKVLREPLKEYGSKEVKITYTLRPEELKNG